MSASNVAIVRGLFEAFDSGDALGLVGPLNPDLVFHGREDEPDAGVHEGVAAVTELFAGWLETFPDLSLDQKTFRDEGDDWVVASFLLRGRGGASGAEVAERYSWALRLHAGKLVEVREFRTEEEACRAIALQRDGLAPTPP